MIVNFVQVCSGVRIYAQKETHVGPTSPTTIRKSDDAGAALHGGSAAENAVRAAKFETDSAKEASAADGAALPEAAAVSTRRSRRAPAPVLAAIDPRFAIVQKRCVHYSMYKNLPREAKYAENISTSALSNPTCMMAIG